MKNYSGEYVEIGTNKPKTNWKKICIIALIIVIIIIILISLIAIYANRKKDSEPTPNPSFNLGTLITVPNLLNHLTNLEEIARNFSSSRAILFGYNASVEYILSQLANTGLSVTLQPLLIQMTTVVQPANLTQVRPQFIQFVSGTDFRNLGGYNGQITVHQNLSIVNNYGCVDSDYVNLNSTIALVLRGNCTFREKILLAAQRNASGILIYNNARGLFSGSTGGFIPIPAFALTDTLGTLLVNGIQAGERIVLNMFSHEITFNTSNSNIIAETSSGRADRVILIGSHLDSVPAGPGINDNGSGSSLNLELAIQLAKSEIVIKNKVRFAWWAAEEIGLVGSTYYVNDLVNNNPDELKNIALNLNFDMVASPNFFFGIYNGTDAAPNIRNASTIIQRSFEEYFDSVNTPFLPTPFTGRSDYGPFIANGIPAGGLFTGAEQIKTAAQQELFGGIANVAYDPCYHLKCDDLTNINQKCYAVTSQAAAYVVQKYATADNIDALLQ